jgi:spermidine/putrescine transport system permease protein
MAIRLPRGMNLVHALLGSWTGLVMLFLYLPIAILVIYSFNDSKLNVQWSGFTFEWYRRITADAVLMASLKNSLIIALVTTVLSVILGTLGAWLLYRYRFPLPRALATLIFIPMVIPEIIMGISLLIFFAAANRWGNWLLETWGISESDPLALGMTTVIIAHTTFCFPFVLVAVRARLAGVDPAMEEAAMDLGATPLQAFGHVMVPYLLPAIISGALMAFTLSMDELIVTYFTASASSQTLPLVIFGRVKKGLDPSLNAISTLFIIATALLVLAAEWVRKWNRQPKETL